MEGREWDSLAIRFWELYIIVNEKGSTTAEVLDGSEIKFSFRRRVNK